MRDAKFTTDSRIVNLHPTKGTHWVMFVSEFYFDSYGCPPPTNILNHIKKRYLFGISNSDRRQLLSAYCLYVLYLTKIIGFKNAVLNLYYLKLTK